MKISALMAFVLATTLVLSIQAQTTWHVAAAAPAFGNGSPAQPFQTIQDGIAVAQTGDTLLVEPGSYGGLIDLGAKGLVIKSSQGRSQTFIHADANHGNGQLLVTGSGAATARIEGFTLAESPGFDLQVAFEGSTIEVVACNVLIDVLEHRLTIVSTWIDNCYFSDARLTHSITSNFPPSGTVLITNSEFTAPNVLPSSFPPSTLRFITNDLTLDGCYVHDTASVVANNSGNLTIRNAIISNVARLTEGSGPAGSMRLIEDCSLDAIPYTYFSYSSTDTAPLGTTTTIRRVSATNCGRWSITAQQVLFEDCVFDGLTPGGDHLVYPVESHIVISRCQVRNCAAQALVYHPDHIYSLEMFGCAIANSSGPIFSRGPLTIRHGSVANHSSSSGPLLQSLAAIQVENSILRGGTASYALPQATFVNCNIEGGWNGPGHDNVDVDPQFVDVSTGDLHLLNTSPMIDAGSAESNAGLDLDGQARRIGRYSDIGADEYDSGTFALRGTDEDVHMTTEVNLARVNGLGVDVAGGDLVSLTIESPGGYLVGAPVYVCGEVFTTGGSPILPAGHPQVHMNLLNADLLFDPAIASGLPGWSFGLPSSGLHLAGPVPFGFSGVTYRIQAFAVWPLTLNGWYASSDAIDLVHP